VTKKSNVKRKLFNYVYKVPLVILSEASCCNLTFEINYNRKKARQKICSWG